MNITLREDGAGHFVICFDETEIRLRKTDLDVLSGSIRRMLTSVDIPTPDPEADLQEFSKRLSDAGDVGMQAFIQTADHNDLVVLLRATEADGVLQKKLFQNMSPTNRKIFLEDVEYSLQNQTANRLAADALARLQKVIEMLEADGRLK